MSKREVDPTQVVDAILVKGHHIDLYLNNPLFRHQVDNLVRLVIPAFLEGLTTAAEEAQEHHEVAMAIIKQGVKDAGFKAGGLP